MHGAGQGQYDLSPGFIASQSFTDPKGRRVLFGWVGGPSERSNPPGSRTGFTGAQSIPRLIETCSAAPDSALCFRPLPELASLRTSTTPFSTVAAASSGSQMVLVARTSNSFGDSLLLLLLLHRVE